MGYEKRGERIIGKCFDNFQKAWVGIADPNSIGKITTYT